MKKYFKAISCILVFAMFFTMIPVPAFAANEEQTSGGSDQSVQKAEAKIIGEVIEKREKNVKHFLKDDMTFEVAVYPVAVHFKDADGKWKDIDNTLAANTDEEKNEVLENKANDYKVKFAKKSDARKLVSIKKDKYELSWGLEQDGKDQKAASSSAINSVPVKYVEPQYADVVKNFDDNQKAKFLTDISSIVEYQGVFPGVDLQYEVKPEIVKETIIINEKTNNAVYSFTLDTKNLLPKLEEDNEIVFYDSDDATKQVFKMQAPFMIDAAGKISNDIKVTLETDKGGNKLILEPDKAWLDSPDRVFPIKIDPAVQTRSEYWLYIHDRYIDSLGPNQNWNYERLWVYKADNREARSLISFDMFPQLTSADYITQAYLSLNYIDQGNYVSVHKVESPWDETTVTWNNQPAAEPISPDYQALNLYQTGANFVNWDITGIVRDWYVNQNNYGLELRAVGNPGGAWILSSEEGSYGYIPKIIINYVNNSGIEDYWTYHAQDIKRAGAGYVNDSSGNLTFIHNDLSMTGNRMPVTINHVYSQNTRNTDIGYGAGWRLNLSQTLVKKELGFLMNTGVDHHPLYLIGNYPTYVYTDEDGTEHYFKTDPNAGYTTQQYLDESGKGLTLVMTYPYGSTIPNLEIKDKAENKLGFGSSNYLQYIKDKNGNTIYLNYAADGTTLSSITDGARRITTLNYINGKLSSITDPSSRVAATFEYTGNQLTKISYRDNNYSLYNYDTDNKLKSVTNYDGYKIVYDHYDLFPYRIKKILETHVDGTLGQELNIEYSNNTTIFKDINGRPNIYQFNNSGNTVSIRDNEGSANFYKYYTEGNIKNKISVDSQFQKTVTNYVKNHNAEFDRDWVSASIDGSTGTAVYATDSAFFGSRSLKVQKTNTQGSQSYTQTLNLTQGKTFTLSGYIKTKSVSNSNNKGAALIVAFFNGQTLLQTQESKYVNGTNDWNRYEVSFTVPSNATGVEIRAGIVGETGTAYFDSLQLENGPISNKYNLVENPDFTYGSNTPDFWTVYGDSSDTLVTLNDPNYTKNLDNRAFLFNGVYLTPKSMEQGFNISGKKGDSFVVGGWAKGTLSPGKEERLELKFDKSDGSSYYKWVPFNASLKDWQYVSENIVADADYTKVTLTIRINTYINSVYFDGLHLYKEPYGVNYGYNSNGNLSSITDQASQQSSFEYSGNDVTWALNSHGAAKYTYDNNHNLTGATSSENVKNSFTYDSYGNQLTTKVGDSVLSFGITNTYTTNGNYLKTAKDASGNEVIFNYDEVKGTLGSFVDAKNNATSYTYDDLDRLKDVEKTVDGVLVKNTYTYDKDQINSITHNGFSYTFGFDSLKRPKSVSIGTQSLITNDYVPRTGNLNFSTYGNDQKVGYDYDNLERVTAKKYNDTVRYKYEYDAKGNVGLYEDTQSNVKHRYIFDLANRLEKIEDSLGNITNFFYNAKNSIVNLIENFAGSGSNVTGYSFDSDNRPLQTYFNSYNNANIEFFSLNNNTVGTKGTRPISQQVAMETDSQSKPVTAIYEGKFNGLTNYSFEDGPWSIEGYYTMCGSRVTGDGVDGVKSLEFYNDQPIGSGIVNNYSASQSYWAAQDLVPPFTFNAWVKRIGAAQPTVELVFPYDTVRFSFDIPEGKWTRVSKTINVGYYAYGMKVKLLGAVGPGEIIRYDGVSLVTNSAIPTPVMPNYPAGHLKYDLNINKNSGTAFTWFNTKVLGTVRNVIANEISNAGNLNLYIGTDNRLKLSVKNSSGVQTDLISTTETISKDTWYFGGLKWNTNGSTLTVFLYLNDKVYSASTTNFQDFSGAETIIGSTLTKQNQLNGTFDQFAYSADVLADSELMNFYQRGRGSIVNNTYDSLGRLNRTELYTGNAQFNTAFNYILKSPGVSTDRLGEIDNNGNKISYTYDANGNIETITEAGKEIKYSYNELNEVVREDNQVLNKTITYAYDVGGNFTSKKEYAYTTGTLGTPTKTYSYAYTDPVWKDKMTSYDSKAITYDAIGNPLTYDDWTYCKRQVLTDEFRQIIFPVFYPKIVFRCLSR